MSYNNGPKPKLSRDEKKAKRRNAQNAKLEQKSKQEAAHFWQCAGRGGDAVPRLGAAELFASQSTGINFAQYEAIPVTRGKVSEADVAPLQTIFASAKVDADGRISRAALKESVGTMQESLAVAVAVASGHEPPPPLPAGPSPAAPPPRATSLFRAAKVARAVPLHRALSAPLRTPPPSSSCAT